MKAIGGFFSISNDLGKSKLFNEGLSSNIEDLIDRTVAYPVCDLVWDNVAQPVSDELLDLIEKGHKEPQ